MIQEIILLQVPPPRLSLRTFPPYRHVPGLHPHPVANPQGHSYHPAGQHPAAGPMLAPERWPECEDYLYGIDLYNHWYWWEAHEAWEGIWQQSDKAGVQGRFLQGLIQISAAQLKRHVGQAEGVARLLERSDEHLNFVCDCLSTGLVYMGLNLITFRGAVTKWFEGSSNRFPFIILQETQAF